MLEWNVLQFLLSPTCVNQIITKVGFTLNLVISRTWFFFQVNYNRTIDPRMKKWNRKSYQRKSWRSHWMCQRKRSSYGWVYLKLHRQMVKMLFTATKWYKISFDVSFTSHNDTSLQLNWLQFQLLAIVQLLIFIRYVLLCPYFSFFDFFANSISGPYFWSNVSGP